MGNGAVSLANNLAMPLLMRQRANHIIQQFEGQPHETLYMFKYSVTIYSSPE